MKITEVRPFLFNRFLLVRVYTDAGLVGTGEAGNWAHHDVTCQCLREIAEYYVGKDPRAIEHHFQAVSRRAHFMGSDLSAALSAIAVALWDILGKSVSLPVHQLLGGACRDRVKVYQFLNGHTREEIAESAERGLEAGFTAFRMTPLPPSFEKNTSTRNISEAVRMVADAREALGDGIDLGLEIHRNLKPDEAIILGRELESFRILYYEDPVAPQSIDALEYVARHVRIPIATGERFYSMYQFKDLIDRKIVSLIRPDLSLAGGFTQAKKIAAQAEAAFVGVFPHLMGTPVNTAAFVQLAAAIPNYAMMEANGGNDDLGGAIIEPVPLVDGYRILPDKPGIGIELDEEALAKQPPHVPTKFDPSTHADGSVAH